MRQFLYKRSLDIFEDLTLVMEFLLTHPVHVVVRFGGHSFAQNGGECGRNNMGCHGW